MEGKQAVRMTRLSCHRLCFAASLSYRLTDRTTPSGDDTPPTLTFSG